MEGKMRKFKLFIASMLTYFMAISLLPTSLLQTIAKAAENEYTTLVKSDYYLRAESQYYNKTLLAYGDAKDVNGKGKITISIVENGKETILKEIEGYNDIRLYEKKGSVIGIRAFKDYKNYDEQNNIYETIDLNTNKFNKISYEELKKFIADGNYIYEPIEPIKDKEQLEKVLNKINVESGSDLTIKDKTLAENEYGTVYNNENETISFNIYADDKTGEVIRFGINRNIKVNDYEYKTNYYAGLTYKDYTFVKVFKYYERDQYVVGKEGKNLYIWDKLSDNNEYNLIKVVDGKFISSNKITLPENVYPNLKTVNDKIYVSYYNKLYIYSLNNNEYKLENNISIVPNGVMFNNDSVIALEPSEDKVFISKITDSKVNKLVDVTEDYNKLFSDGNDYLMNFKVFNENNMIILGLKGFIIVQKEGQESIPEEPTNPEEPNTPGDNGNVVVIPSDDKVIAEVSKINPNDKNEIKVNTEASAKKIEVLIKDIESLKSGTGSLNITINNGVTMNLPLSTIDKSLLEGADNVTIKLDVVENSDIIKQIKAVNKVFDFNLIINKGNESLNIHNFKDGLAEVTLNLTDEDLKELNKDKLVVYYYNDVEKTFEAMETVVNGNKITFKTPHFSKYVVAEKVTDTNGGSSPSEGANDNTNNNTETGKGNLPETGSVVSNNVILVLAIGIVAIGGIMFFRKRKHA
jgi:LPXTG-motif cell wall-anchored protein